MVILVLPVFGALDAVGGWNAFMNVSFIVRLLSDMTRLAIGTP